MATNIPVKVFLRVRPLSNKEIEQGCAECIQCLEESSQLIIANKMFTFDGVFAPITSQNAVYKSTSFPLIEHLFKGFNCTILAYGQTGYTMDTESTSFGQSDNHGITPRIIFDIFETISISNIKATVSVSMVEIHNENVWDLLSNDRDEPLQLRDGPTGGVNIPNLTKFVAKSCKEALDFLEIGCRQRSKGGTAMNAQSSRSHAVFTITLHKPAINDDAIAFESKLHLVDLAGSERLKKTLAEGDRKKEGIQINQGLLALGNVISALTDSAQIKHVPYRDSRITRLLQDSLGGNSYTVFIACCSPADTNAEESLSTLRYAERARSIKNKPVLNVNPSASTIQKLKATIEQLRKEFAESKSWNNYNEEGTQILIELRRVIDGIVFENLDEAVRDTDNKEIKSLKEELQLSKYEVADLKKQLLESESSNNEANRYLADQWGKTKQSRAQIRCDYLQLKREHQRLLDEHKFLEESQKSLHTDNATCQELNKKITELSERLKAMEKDQMELVLENNVLKTTNDDLLKKVSDSNREFKELESCEQARALHFSQELEVANGRIEMLKQAIKTLDDHSEHLMNQVKNTSQKKCRAEEHVARLNAELDVLRQKCDSKMLTEENCSKLTEENKRLISRVEYLETELRETHTDHREELAKLAKQITLSKANPGNTISKETMIRQLESELRQKDSQIRSFERQVDQAKNDVRNFEKEMNVLRDEQIKLVNENTSLRQGLADAIKKIQERDKSTEELKESQETLSTDLTKANVYKTELEDENQQLKEEIAQKEKLIAYLQSQVQPKQLPKIKGSTTRCSILLSSGSDSLNSTDIENETRQCEELEARRDQLKSTLEQQKKILSERQKNEAIPLLKGSPSKAIHSIANDDTWSTQEDVCQTTSSKSNRMGTMRHEIPHRWKKHFVSLLGAKCAICLEGVPRFRHAMKCRECDVTVHRHCLPRVANTCGLPVAIGEYYLDSHYTQFGDMNGWVKLLRSGNKWRNAWASICGHQLKFADTDNLTSIDGNFLSIDLDSEQWRIYNQSGQISGINSENLSMLIEIKLPTYTLYMLTPTAQAKQRWVQALQSATNRRMQRRHSSHPAGNLLLLALDKPQNLGIHCTVMFDDWLLIGAEEGLFATNYLHPRAPFNISGISTLEYVKECEMILAVCDKKRLLVAIHVQQLRRALNDSNFASILTTSVVKEENIHLAVVSKINHCDQRYVYMATIDAIHVLQYVSKRGMFSSVATIHTEEPCMCITSVPGGLVFGADTFYSANASENFEARPFFIENCPPDFPVAVVTISDYEILVVYHNYGVFVSPQGRRTRKDNLEWERAPLEFVYTAPYLYIAYCEFLEIVQIAPFEGNNSRTILDDRDVYRCRSAHYTGLGANPNEVLFSVSGLNRVELHLFNAVKSGGMRSGSLKRKLNETFPILNNSKRKL